MHIPLRQIPLEAYGPLTNLSGYYLSWTGSLTVMREVFDRDCYVVVKVKLDDKFSNF